MRVFEGWYWAAWNDIQALEKGHPLWAFMHPLNFNG